MPHPFMPWDFALILAVLAILVPWRGTVKMRQLLARPFISSMERLTLYASTIVFQWAGVAVIAWRVHARGVPAQHLGLTVGAALYTALIGTALSLLLVVYQLAGLRRFARMPGAGNTFLHEMAAKVLPQNAVEALAFVALVATVALCEEFIYRGFALAVLARAGAGSLLFGAVLSSVLFAAAHAYQGRRGVVLTFLIGVLFAVARIWTGSLVPSMAAHFATDLAAGLAAPRMLRRQTTPNL